MAPSPSPRYHLGGMQNIFASATPSHHRQAIFAEDDFRSKLTVLIPQVRKSKTSGILINQNLGQVDDDDYLILQLRLFFKSLGATGVVRRHGIFFFDFGPTAENARAAKEAYKKYHHFLSKSPYITSEEWRRGVLKETFLFMYGGKARWTRGKSGKKLLCWVQPHANTGVTSLVAAPEVIPAPEVMQEHEEIAVSTERKRTRGNKSKAQRPSKKLKTGEVVLAGITSEPIAESPHPCSDIKRQKASAIFIPKEYIRGNREFLDALGKFIRPERVLQCQNKGHYFVLKALRHHARSARVCYNNLKLGLKFKGHVIYSEMTL